MNPYDELDLPKDASDADIKKAYRDKAKKEHPDKGGNKDKFAMVSNAYDILKDKYKRQYYDKHGNEPPKQDINEQKALSLISQLIEGVLDAADDNIIYKDIIYEMNAFIKSKIFLVNQIRDASKQSLKNMNKLQKIFNKRIKHKKKKSKTNFFLSIIKMRIEKLNNHIEQMDNEEKIYNIASDMINDFEFKFDNID